MQWRIRAAVVLALLALGGCFQRKATRPSSSAAQPSAPRGSGGRYAQANDSTPARIPDISTIPEPVPRNEPRSAYGNKSPYSVLGETYRVLPSCKDYDERGLASWYGNKFHGYTTSNFEKYDMYAYSAASKVLPIPCYVRVTNLENGRSAIVRVNDRGPFVANRIIDLSFVAAIKLGVYPQGTAMVEVRGIDPDHPQRSAEPARGDAVTSAPGKTPKPLLYLQVGAFADPANAERAAARVRAAHLGSVAVIAARIDGKTLRRVRVGPLRDAADADALAPKLRALGLGEVRVSIDN
ncbi:MAG: septal ring lytic transglycosylase RlpA family protein [Proteobacteria bacterium]|nr:septal ring lytic transglycosylase RlpA family protein [Pseudomonadota bacterium]